MRVRMKMWLAAFAVVAVGLVVLATDQPEIVIKFAHSDAPDWHISKKHAMALTIKSYVESMTGGRVRVDIYPAGELGGEREYCEGIITGAIEMGTLSGPMAMFFPPAMVLDIPYIFPNFAVARQVLDGWFGQKLSEALYQELHVYNFAFGETGFRNFTNNVRPIHTPDDMEGLKIRVMESPIYMRMVEALGATPTPIAWTEVYSALQTGVVDGQENPVATIIYAKLYEVQKYLTLDGHSYGADWILINGDFYESLPEEIQRILREAVHIGATAGRALQQIPTLFDPGIPFLQEQGMEIYAPTSEELAQFRALAQPPVIEWLQTQIDVHWIEDLQQAVREAEEEIYGGPFARH